MTQSHLKWKHSRGCWRPAEGTGDLEGRFAIVEELDRFFVTTGGNHYGPYHNLEEAKEKGEELLSSRV
ncbi:MAG: hypothetical protein ABEK50_15755 [bacterium]